MDDRRIKLAIDILGILASISALWLFYTSEKYTVFAILVIVTLGLITYAVYLIRTPPYSVKELTWEVQIHDERGSRATARKITTIVANQRNVCDLYDRNFASTGNFRFIESNMGDLHGPIEEGGTWTIVTILRAPLTIGQRVVKELLVEVDNTFLEKKETFSTLINHRMQQIVMRVELPKQRPAIKATALMLSDKAPCLLHGLELSTDRSVMLLKVEKPVFGAKYLIEWTW